MEVDVIDYSLLPEHLRDGMRRYVEHGIRPGHFLTAVLENDLLEAFNRADETSAYALKNIAEFLQCQLPMECYGSFEAVNRWVNGKTKERLG